MGSVHTRTKYRIVGSDYSAQEPRMTAHLCAQFAEDINPETGEKLGNRMKDAYMEGKDLYAMIAMSAYDNNYEDNLEFWPEGTELEIDGKKVIAGDNKQPIEVEISTENNSVELKRSNILDIVNKGEVQAAFLQVGDQTIEGPTITKIEPKNNKIIVYFDC